MCDNNSETTNCIGNVLKVILALQQNACPGTCLDSCDRPVLGGGPNCLVCNTRPVMLYLNGSNGTALSMPTTKDPTETTTTSDVFRVEKVEGNCATFRVLVPATEPITPGQTYTGTSSFFTVNLNCCCMCRCLSDTYVECV